VSLSELDDPGLRAVLAEAAHLMQAGRGRRLVYRRAGRPCPRCGARIRSRPLGDEARVAYWCPACQEGTSPALA
jgi:formamidopyrimidine-DNA glycosylase